MLRIINSIGSITQTIQAATRTPQAATRTTQAAQAAIQTTQAVPQTASTASAAALDISVLHPAFKDFYALVYAIYTNDINAVRTTLNKLAEHNIDINTPISQGRTPLSLAAHRDPAILEALANYKGASLDEADKNGNTPLSLAVRGGNLDNVEVLAEHGALLDEAEANEDGNTPLILAVHGGNLAIIETLLAHGALPDEADKNGNTTPLILAARYRNPTIIKILIAYGACLDKTDKDGNTALTLAGDDVATRDALLEKPAEKYQPSNTLTNNSRLLLRAKTAKQYEVACKKLKAYLSTPDALFQMFSKLTLDECKIVCGTLKDYLPTILKTESSYSQMESELTAEQYEVVYESLRDYYRSITPTIDALYQFLSNKEPEECITVLEIIKDHVSAMIKKIDNNFIQLRGLSPEKFSVLCEVLKDHLPNIINVADFWVLSRHVPHEKFPILCAALQPGLPTIIKTLRDLNHLRTYLWPLQFSILFKRVKEHLPVIIKASDFKTDDFFEFVSMSARYHLSDEEFKKFVYEPFKDRLPDIFRTASDFYLLCRLPDNYFKIVCESLKDYLLALIKTPADFRAFRSGHREQVKKAAHEQEEVIFQILEARPDPYRKFNVICEILKERLPAFIETASDYFSINFCLSSEDQKVLFESIRYRLSDLIKTGGDFNLLIRCASSPEQVNLIWENAKDRFPSLIPTAKELALTLYDLSFEQGQAICERIKDHVPTIIKNAKDFKEIEHLSYEIFPLVLEILKDRLPAFIETVDDYFTIMSISLPLGYKERLSASIRHRVSDIVKTGRHFNLLRRLSSSPEQVKWIWENVKDRFPSLIPTVSELSLTLQELPLNECMMICERIKDHLPTIIKSLKDLKDLREIRCIRIEIFKLICASLRERLPDFIKTASDYCTIASFYSFSDSKDMLFEIVTNPLFGHKEMPFESKNGPLLEYKDMLFEIIRHRLSDLIKTGSDFNLLWHRLLSDSKQRNSMQLKDGSPSDSEEIQLIWKNVEDRFPSLIPTAKELALTLQGLPLEQCERICERIKDHLPSLFPTVNDLVLTLQGLPLEQCKVICEHIKDHLPKIVKNVKDLKAIRSLKIEVFKLVCKSLEDRLPKIMSTADNTQHHSPSLLRDKVTAIFGKLKLAFTSVQGKLLALIQRPNNTQQEKDPFTEIYKTLRDIPTAVDVNKQLNKDIKPGNDLHQGICNIVSRHMALEELLSHSFPEIDAHPYGDGEINTLLHCYLKNRNDIAILNGVNLENLNRFVEILSNNIDTHTQSEEMGNPIRAMVVPVHLEHHWAALYIQYGADRSCPQITYIDPLGKYTTLKDLKQVMKRIYPKSSVSIPNIRLQVDGYNSGPWVVALFEYLVREGRLPPETLNFNVDSRRAFNAYIMKCHPVPPAPTSSLSAPIARFDYLVNQSSSISSSSTPGQTKSTPAVSEATEKQMELSEHSQNKRARAEYSSSPTNKAKSASTQEQEEPSERSPKRARETYSSSPTSKAESAPSEQEAEPTASATPKEQAKPSERSPKRARETYSSSPTSETESAPSEQEAEPAVSATPKEQEKPSERSQKNRKIG